MLKNRPLLFYFVDSILNERLEGHFFLLNLKANVFQHPTRR